MRENTNRQDIFTECSHDRAIRFRISSWQTHLCPSNESVSLPKHNIRRTCVFVSKV